MYKIAIVGAGPAGSSAALKLLRNPSVKKVRMFDRSLVPWGLLRTGVAPDHPEVKATARAWTSIGNSKNFEFYGGVNIGKRNGFNTLDNILYNTAISILSEAIKYLTIKSDIK